MLTALYADAVWKFVSFALLLVVEHSQIEVPHMTIQHVLVTTAFVFDLVTDH